MGHSPLWSEPLFQETFFLVLGFLMLVGLTLVVLGFSGPRFKAARASVRSWMFAAPLVLLVMGLPSPYPLMALTLVAIFGAKTFFRMVGIYHRTWFVWLTYIFVVLFALICHWHDALGPYYNLLPMIFGLVLFCIPLVRNSPKHMIQYIALTFMALLFFGWSLMHMGRLMTVDRGIYIVIYIYILIEFSESVQLAAGRFFGRTPIFSNISSRMYLEALAANIALTLLLAWGLRHMLPVRTEVYWVAAGLSASLFGRLGELNLSVVRRDLGIKESGVFIIGRDDILARLDKLILVGPVFFYVMKILEQANF